MYREVLMLRDVEGLTAAAATRFSERSRSAASRPRRRPCRLRSRPPWGRPSARASAAA